jgi:UDP-glucose 4-epimerase
MSTHLITGGAGFIGSHLAETLLERGDQVVVLDDLSTGRISNISHLEGNPGFRCLIENVCNEALTEELIREADSIFHLAASVGSNWSSNARKLINNILGTEIVLR